MKVTIALADASINKKTTLGMLPRIGELIDIFGLLNRVEREAIKEEYDTYTFLITGVTHQVSEMHHIATLWIEPTE
jgi:hypothetical protein